MHSTVDTHLFKPRDEPAARFNICTIFAYICDCARHPTSAIKYWCEYMDSVVGAIEVIIIIVLATRRMCSMTFNLQR